MKMPIAGLNMLTTLKNTRWQRSIVVSLVSSSLLLAACSNDDDNPAAAEAESSPKVFTTIIGTDNNSQANSLLSLNPGGPGGSPNQSLRGGDVLVGNTDDNVIIGGLGVDILLGYDGDDILIGGTEDFNSSVDGDNNGSDNRDRAFGHAGDDVFIWAPGDGSDFFDGGEGTDVVIFGVLGESRDSDNNTAGAPFFGVNLPGTNGSQDFDGINLDANNQPRVRSSNSPGFCSIVEAALTLEQVNLDHLVRFSIRGIADGFDSGTRNDDDGLRVAVSLKNTEYVVCTRRNFDANQQLENVEVLDISNGRPVTSSIEDLPDYVQDLII